MDEKRDAVLAVTCGTSDMGEEFRLIREYLFPAFDAPAGGEAQQAELAERIAALQYGFPTDDGSDVPLPEAATGRNTRAMPWDFPWQRRPKIGCA